MNAALAQRQSELAPTYALGVGGAAGSAVLRQSPELVLAMHAQSATFYEMTHAKGELTEALMSRFFREGLLESSGRWVAGTPATVGRGGIDGLFFRTDSNGNMRKLLVSEAKYGSSQLGYTRSGKQMDAAWVNERLARTSRLYRDFLQPCSPLEQGCSHGASHASSRIQVPLRDGGSATVYRVRNRQYYYCNDKTVTAAEVRQQLRRTHRFLESAAAGRINYKTQLFKYRAVGDTHIIQMIDARTWKTSTFNGRFDDLPPRVQNVIRREFERLFVRELKKSPEEARKLADRACKDPQYFRKMAKKAQLSLRHGLDAYAAMTAAIGFLVSAGFDLIGQWWSGGKIDYGRTGVLGGLGAVSAFAGYYSGTQISSLLIVTKSGKILVKMSPLASVAGRSGAAAIGVAGGAIVGVAVFSYGSYLLGLIDAQTANRQMLQGTVSTIGGFAAVQGSMSLVTAYGTASTGTAISQLSGAAATKASLAWFGGGSVATSGGGAAIGVWVLGGIAAAAGFALYSAISLGFKMLNDREQKLLIKGRLDLSFQRLEEGTQPEWCASLAPAT